MSKQIYNWNLTQTYVSGKREHHLGKNCKLLFRAYSPGNFNQWESSSGYEQVLQPNDTLLCLVAQRYTTLKSVKIICLLVACQHDGLLFYSTPLLYYPHEASLLQSTRHSEESEGA